MADRLFGHRAAATIVAALLAVTAPLAAQDGTEAPMSHFMLAGYGSVTYTSGLTDQFENDFATGISPILLFHLHPDALIEAEFEFGLEGGETTTALEYAQVNYQGFETVQIVAGKFLLPFGVFGERLHPSWINKLPTMPSLYGHAHGGVATGANLPVPSDVGVMLRLNQPAGGLGNLDLSLYVTQGPRELAADAADGGDGHAHSVVPTLTPRFAPGHGDAAAATSTSFDIPTVAFGVSVPDNNRNKLFGARLGLVRGPSFEAYVSAFHAMYDPDDYLDMLGMNVAAEWRRGPLEVRGEGMLLRQEFSHEGEYRTLESPAYYLQVSRRFGAIEPVVRWSHLLESMVDHAMVRDAQERLTAGAIYWAAASIPIKVAYEWNRYAPDQIFLQWAFGL